MRLEGAYRSVDQAFDARGDRVTLTLGGGPADYRVQETRAYLEYGAAPGWTLIAAGDWKNVTVAEAAATFRTRGFGDLRLGVRHGFSRGGAWPVALQGELTVPTGYDRKEIPALGSGRLEAAVALQFGHGFRGGYVTADAGYRAREQGVADQIPLSAQLGFDGPGATSFRGGVRGRVALDSAAGGADPTVSERSLWAISGAVAWAVTSAVEIEAGATDTVSGRNALPGVEFSLAVAVVRH